MSYRDLRYQRVARFSPILSWVPSEEPTPRYTYLGMLAGAAIGLLVGIFLVTTTVPHQGFFDAFALFTFFGLIFLVVGTLLFGLPVVKLLNRNEARWGVTLLVAVGLGCGITVLIGLVGSLFDSQIAAQALRIAGLPTICSATVSGLLVTWLSRSRTASFAIIAAVLAIGIYGVVRPTFGFDSAPPHKFDSPPYFEEIPLDPAQNPW